MGLAVVVIGFLAQTFAAVDITGKWTATFDTQIGEQIYTYTFQVKGSELTGSAVSNLGKAVLKNGKVDGDTVTFVEELDFMGMLLKSPTPARSFPTIRSTSPEPLWMSRLRSSWRNASSRDSGGGL